MGTIANKNAQSVMTIAFMDGEVSDAGIGLACQATLRAATQNTFISFRETEIGLIPAAGVIYAMRNLLGKGPAIGMYLTLTGATINGMEAVRFGLANHFMSSSCQDNILYTFDNLVFSTTHDSMFTTILSHFSEQIDSDPSFDQQLALICEIFKPDSLRQIVNRLERQNNTFARKALE